MQMDAPPERCASLGYEDVRTYIRSGNVVFEASESEPGAIGGDQEEEIADEFGYDATVMVRTRDELEAIVERQPFDASDDGAIRRYVTFLHEEPSVEGIEAFLATADEAERFEVVGQDVYSEIDKDALGNRSRTDAGKQFGTPATRRYWNVVTSVLELASD